MPEIKTGWGLSWQGRLKKPYTRGQRGYPTLSSLTLILLDWPALSFAGGSEGRLLTPFCC